MNDPYKVLGVSPNATDAQVKDAYRAMARKYHPDHYVNNPLSDLALEKMQEINEAYDTIMNQRRTRFSGGSSNSYSGGGSSYSSGNSGYCSTQFADIRRLIMAKRFTEAEELLDGVPQHCKDAEWHFLKGSVQYSRGWLDEAYNNFSKACAMEPGNQEFRAALNQLLWQRQHAHPGRGYHTANPGYSTQSCSMCDVCTTLYCADCCCECMGGDLIRCC